MDGPTGAMGSENSRASNFFHKGVVLLEIRIPPCFFIFLFLSFVPIFFIFSCVTEYHLVGFAIIMK